MENLKTEMIARCKKSKKSANAYDAIQNEVMREFFGDDYYNHVGSGDDVDDAYNATSEIRSDFVLKL